MIEETGCIQRDLLVSSDYLLRGMVLGSVTVVNGGYLELYGMVSQDLFVERGGIVTLHGLVTGDVYNRGGDLEVYGTINGTLHDEGGVTVIDPGAVIGGLRGGG